MRISDWSSDVCSSDLAPPARRRQSHDPIPATNPPPPICSWLFSGCRTRGERALYQLIELRGKTIRLGRRHVRALGQIIALHLRVIDKMQSDGAATLDQHVPGQRARREIRFADRVMAGIR